MLRLPIKGALVKGVGRQLGICDPAVQLDSHAKRPGAGVYGKSVAMHAMAHATFFYIERLTGWCLAVHCMQGASDRHGYNTTHRTQLRGPG